MKAGRCSCVLWNGQARQTSRQVRFFDFNEEPDLEIVSNTDTTEWRASGGVDDSGYLSPHRCRGVVLKRVSSSRLWRIRFPRLSLESMLASVAIKIGQRMALVSTSSAQMIQFWPIHVAVGMPLNHSFPGWEGLQEEGSQTGLGIGFDTWDNGKFNAEALNDGVGF